MFIKLKKHPMIQGERLLYFVSVIILLLVAAIISNPFDVYFIPNFLYLFGLPLAVLFVLLCLKARPAIIFGTALSIGIFFFAYSLKDHTHNSLPWLDVFLTLPGALFGAIAAMFLFNKNNNYNVMLVSFLTVIFVLLSWQISYLII